MGKLFGTDGIRGIVGENLTVELAFHTGQAIAAVLKEEKGRAPLITIGKDTRISSDMLESALICGICSVGGDVMPFGVLPTPAVAYLTVLKGADAGIVISASHNPFEHNGIKVFNEKGYKLPDATEAKIEEKILSGETIPVATRGEIGVLHHGLKQSKLEYIHHLTTTIDSDLSGLRVLVDCANGAASATAPELFRTLQVLCRFHPPRAERHEHQRPLRLHAPRKPRPARRGGEVRRGRGLRRRRRPLPDGRRAGP